MKIAILDDYQDVVRNLDCFKLLKEHDVKVFNNRAVGLGQLAIRLASFDALVLIRERTRLNRNLLCKLPNLKVIAQTGRLAGNIDLDAAHEQGIAVLEGTGDPTAPAELTWALIMASSRKIPQYHQFLKEGIWQTASLHPQYNQLGRVLRGRRLGIWGYGKVGQLLATYAKAFGMQVFIWGSPSSRARALDDGNSVYETKQQLFNESDIVSVHLRLTDQTRACITLSDLLSMQINSLFVNTSRAELVAPGALELALDQGRPGFAAIDVFESEPLIVPHPLIGRENVLATPHIGFVEKDSYERYFGAAFQSLLDFQQNHPNEKEC
ncbi:D-2-hydroxyacid dehydrogenase family protein [Undibacterium fentianense]|uniref:D-2-hydroxyacid dehydrogenase family protein n=1 Tax=Undibacterium fentianense TaxID=2828728 RepID=A0A941E7Y0_9BURK|nr:D-2-hydroxyacid dehydrogenase family protein [Undibacterium fentianense]MBR7800333.1 D-2-hydroxyacid dehydrogenase family protein [Undibacterium fentianense]